MRALTLMSLVMVSCATFPLSYREKRTAEPTPDPSPLDVERKPLTACDRAIAQARMDTFVGSDEWIAHLQHREPTSPAREAEAKARLLWVMMRCAELSSPVVTQPYQSDATGCCSYHQGICGRAAGRILCCDGTLSKTCRE